MKNIGISEQKKATIAELLEKNAYYGVPVFQREFSWKKDEWSDLYEDIERALKNDSQHFFGFMMLKPEGEQKAMLFVFCLSSSCILKSQNYTIYLEKENDSDSRS